MNTRCITVEDLQVMCGHPPFLLIYLWHPGHLLSIFLMIFSLSLSAKMAPAAVFRSYSSQVIPSCHGVLWWKHAANPHKLQVIIGCIRSAGCSWPKEQLGPRHQRKLGSWLSRARRVARVSYL